MVRVCVRQARGPGFESHSAQLSIWNRKTLAQHDYHIYWQIPLRTHDYLTNSIRNVGVATDEGPSPRLALNQSGSRGNIES